MQIAAAGNLLYAESRGEGPPIVFIHGLGAGGSIWFAAAETLASSHRAVTYDWLGSGASPRPRIRYSIEGFAEEAKGVCEALGIGRAVIVGHSMAAAVAVTLAARHPGLARGLVLLGPVVQLKEAAIPVFRDRAAKVRAEGMGPIAEALPGGALSAASRESNPALHGLFRAMILANDPEIYALHCEALLGSTAAVLVPEVACPTLLLAGDCDPVAPPAAVTELAARFRSARVEIAAGAGHAMQLDQPRAVAGTIARFAAGLP